MRSSRLPERTSLMLRVMSTRYSRQAVNSVSKLETTSLYMMIVATTSHSSGFLPRMVVSVKKQGKRI